MKKSTKQPRSNNWFLILFLLISPWFWIIVRNRNTIFPFSFKFLSIDNQLLIEETNNLRGELLNADVPGNLSKFVVNKFTTYTFELTRRYLETFDPQYLFFIGDLDLTKSTHSTGPLYLSFLPLIIVGLFDLIQKKKRLLIFILLLTPVPASFIQNHYETLSRIPVFLLLTYVAVIGLVKLRKTRKILTLLLVVLLIFEFFRFSHDFVFHYPRRLANQVILK